MKTLPKSLHTVTVILALAKHARGFLEINTDPQQERKDSIARALKLLGYNGAADPYELAAKALRVWNAEAIAPQRAKAKAALEELAADLNGRDLLAPAAAADPIRVVVALGGGLVQGAVADRPGVSVITIDYDSEGAAADEVRDIPQDGGGFAEATIGGVPAEFNPAWIDAAEAAELADPEAAIALLRRRAAKWEESHPKLAADALAEAAELEAKLAADVAA